MSENHEILLTGDEARLFPILAETSKEKRITSIYLAVLTQIPAMAEEVLGSVGMRVGKRTKIRAFTEVVAKNKVEDGCRPDGLIEVSTGKTVWRAFVETKVGKNDLTDAQVTKYMELAKANGVDAVITISNQFTTRADHSPVTVPKPLAKKVALYHWSWSWLATIGEILAYQGTVDDEEQSYLLRQLNHFLAHPTTGVERFNQMGANWKDVVQAVSNGEALKRTGAEVEETVASWIAEERDLCLHMSSHVGLQVTAQVERRFSDDPAGRQKSQIADLVDNHTLATTIRIPDCASDMEVCAHLARRTVSASMKLKAPLDKKSTKARVNWVLRMLPQDDERLLLRAHWPGRAAPTTKDVASLRADATLLQADNTDMVPHSFEVLMVENLGKRFSGRKTFIEDLERIVPTFYDLVGSNLKSWQAAPPKPVKPRGTPDAGETNEAELEPVEIAPGE